METFKFRKSDFKLQIEVLKPKWSNRELNRFYRDIGGQMNRIDNEVDAKTHLVLYRQIFAAIWDRLEDEVLDS